MQTRRAALTCLSLLALAGALTGGGCSAEQSQLNDVRWNATPELSTIPDTHDEAVNDWVITQNSNLRALNGDVGRAFYWNRPSRLTPEPVR